MPALSHSHGLAELVDGRRKILFIAVNRSSDEQNVLRVARTAVGMAAELVVPCTVLADGCRRLIGKDEIAEDIVGQRAVANLPRHRERGLVETAALGVVVAHRVDVGDVLIQICRLLCQPHLLTDVKTFHIIFHRLRVGSPVVVDESCIV